jgi:hypothetical protein
MAITTNDILRVGARLLWNLTSDIVNVYWVKCTDDNGLSTASLIEDVLELMEEVYDGLVSSIANNATFADVAVTNFTKEENYGSQPWPTLTAGGNVANAVNPGMGVFAWSPSVKSRVVAKKWFAPFTEADNDDGVWGSSLLASVAGAFIPLTGDFEGANSSIWRAKIPHFFDHNTPLVPPEFLDYGDVNVTSNAGFQRRRRPGTGS